MKKLKIFDKERIQLADNTYEFTQVDDEPRFNLFAKALHIHMQACYWVGALFIGIYVAKSILYMSGVFNVSFSSW